MQNFPKDILSDIRLHLEEEKIELTKRIDELKVQDPFTDPERADDNAASDIEASEEADHDRVSALINELTSKRTALESAINRIDAGTYGFCVECHTMIDTDRLSILPTATLCKACEEKKKRSL